MAKLCNRIIEYSFYALFLITPLVFTSATSELFEFSKMWLVFTLTLIIAASWFSKMILQRRILFQRTPLDIPILLFLVSQIFSTLFSLDTHVSIWGYYSRFNGGLISTLSYIFLYYAFISNVGNILMVKRLLKLSLISGLIVALWGLPSHFGYDPTCFIFRGNFDVSCWTDAFQPKVRIFSTLGQPNWLAAYLAILIPISIAFAIKSQITNHKSQTKLNNQNSKSFEHFKNWNFFGIYSLFTILYFIALLYTSSRSGFLGLAFGLFLFFAIVFFSIISSKKIGKEYLLTPFIIIMIISLLIGTPFTKKASEYFKNASIQQSADQTNNQKAEEKMNGAALEVGGTDSGKIRKIVWQGAIDVWKNSPIFGSGVETFAFAYYKFRPIEHNLVSEWDYLYNKAHNEYLNYLATTGLFGLGSYLSIIGLFFFLVFKNLKSQISNLKSTTQNLKTQNNQLLALNLGFDLCVLIFALIGSYLSILVSNFFGFSVVIVNLYFFMIPAFVLVIMNLIKSSNATIEQHNNRSLKISPTQWVFLSFILLTAGYLLITLMRFFVADTNYALGNNLDKAGVSTQAYSYLIKSVSLREDEPTFKDQLSVNNAILAVAAFSQNDTTTSAQFVNQAVRLSDAVVSKHPNNLVFWKTRARVFYNLSQIDNKYLFLAREALDKAHELAPTDAKIMYNLGVLYGQTNELAKGEKILKNTIILKPDYKDVYYALGLFYREQAVDKKGKVLDMSLQKKAEETLNYILNNFASDDAQVIQTLKTWGVKE